MYLAASYKQIKKTISKNTKKNCFLLSIDNVNVTEPISLKYTQEQERKKRYRLKIL